MVSKNQTELEAMTEERDHWRKLAIERQDIINQQQRQLERIGMWEGAFAGGVRSEMDKHIEQLQIERDQYKSKLQYVAETINGQLNVAHEIANHTKHRAEEALNELDKHFASDDVTILAHILRNIAREYAEQSAAFNSELEQAVITVKGNDRFDPINNPELCLIKTRELWDITFNWKLTQHLAFRGISYGEHKDIHALEVISLCKNNQFGEPLIKALQRLGIEWIEANLTGAPKSLDIVLEGLTWAQKHMDSGKAIILFADLSGVSDRRLRTYRDWYKTIDNFSKVQRIAEFLPTQ